MSFFCYFPWLGPSVHIRQADSQDQQPFCNNTWKSLEQRTCSWSIQPCGSISALVYFGSILTVFYPGEDFATKLASVPLFIGLYTVGIIDADRRFNDTPRIMDRIIQIMYHSPSNESSTGHR